MNNLISPVAPPRRTSSTDILAAATIYRNLGFSLLPIRADGSKRPALPSWKELQSRLPTDCELKAWFAGGKSHGIALIGGEVSGNLERLDFDQIGLYEKWRALSGDQAMEEIAQRCVVVQTPTGGYHVYYRCSEPVPGNRVLARRLVGESEIVTLAETRGEGGYTLAPGSPLSCHQDRKPYVLVQGEFAQMPILTRGERDALVSLVEVFDEYVETYPRPEGAPPPETGRVGSAVNELNFCHPERSEGSQPSKQILRCTQNNKLAANDPAPSVSEGEERSGGVGSDLGSILIAAGWTCTGYKDGVGFWRRPGKVGPGISATENHAGLGLFRVFSTNASPFVINRWYKPWEVDALLRSAGTVPGGEKPAGGNDGCVDADDLEEDADDSPMLCGPYLAPASSHLLFGTRGIGKSTLVFGLAAAIARGEPWHGLECGQANVLYMDLESGTRLRVVKMHRLYAPRFGMRECLFFLDKRFRFPEELPRLIEIAERRKIGLVIFDTLRRCFAVRDENDNAEFYHRVAPVLDGLKERGVASLVIAHPPKGIGNSARGAGAQEDAVDVVMSLTMRQGLVTDANGILALTVHKHRSLGLGVPALALRRAGEDKFERVDGEAIERPVTSTPKIRQCEVAIYRALNDNDTVGPTPYGEFYPDLLNAGFSEGTIKAAFVRMKRHGVLLGSRKGYELADPFGPENPYLDELHAASKGAEEVD